MLFGHGLLSSGVGELGLATETTNYMQRLANDQGYVVIATDWTGLSNPDIAMVLSALGDFNRLTQVTERLQQALINAMVLYRTARGSFPADAHFAVAGQPVIDATRSYYMGISLGGIMGTSFMGYDADCDRGVLNVAGGVWSIMFQRNASWPGYQLALASYPAAATRQYLLALAQVLFDTTDPINVAPHLLADLLPGVTPRHFMIQESLGDTSVSNLATEMVARTIGLPVLTDSARMPYGLTVVDGPEVAALTVFDTMPTPLPPESNATPMGNTAHEALRDETSVKEQIRRFLQPGGHVEQTCMGTCDPN
jgi:hypothetical protein